MRQRTALRCSAISLVAILSLAACDDGGTYAVEDGTTASSTTGVGTTTGSGSGGGDASTTTGGQTTGSGGDPGTGGGGGAPPREPEVVATFDPGAGELPEGLALRIDDALVGFATTGEVVSISLSDGARAPFGQLPAPTETSFMTGLGVHPLDGSVYAAMASLGEDVAPGIYVMPPDGGDAVLFASAPEMIFPNGFAWDIEEEIPPLYVADSAAGAIFKIDELGDVELWATDPLLLGDVDACPGAPSDLPIGANGLLISGDHVYVSSTDQGALVRFRINDDEAGPAEIVAGPTCELAGIDGIARDVNGTYLAALNRQDRTVRISAESGEREVVAEGGLLDFPASLAVESAYDHVVTSFALDAAMSGGQGAPALVRVPSR